MRSLPQEFDSFRESAQERDGPSSEAIISDEHVPSCIAEEFFMAMRTGVTCPLKSQERSVPIDVPDP